MPLFYGLDSTVSKPLQDSLPFATKSWYEEFLVLISSTLEG